MPGIGNEKEEGIVPMGIVLIGMDICEETQGSERVDPEGDHKKDGIETGKDGMLDVCGKDQGPEGAERGLANGKGVETLVGMVDMCEEAQGPEGREGLQSEG